MKRIEQVFAKKKLMGKSAFIPYVTAGLPSPEVFFDVIAALERGGADIIEVGLPFSDPVADGPTIQAASSRALKMGISTHKTLELVAQVSPKTRCPIVLMTYVNPVLSLGYEKFAKKAKAAGVAAVIIPDLPVDEASEWKSYANIEDIGTIFLVTPVTPDERVRNVAALTNGFIYYVNLTGVTGAGIEDPASVGKKIAHVKNLSQLPVAAGFGISTPVLAKQLARHADGIIVGSQFLKVLMNAKHGQEIEKLEAEVCAFGKALSEEDNHDSVTR